MNDTTRKRFDMPAIFGPSHVPETTTIHDALALTLSFETTPDAAAALLPRFVRPADKPVVTISRMTYNGVDYLGGRRYQELVISIRAVFESATRRIDANFVPVLWVDEMGPLIAGREFQGLAKLMARFPSMETYEGQLGWKYDAYEYDGKLIDAELFDMQPYGADELARLNAVASEVKTLGWKYMPSTRSEPDCDYPTLSIMRWSYARAWKGQARFSLHQPTFEAAPYSSRVMKVLAALPVVKMGRSFAGQGSALIDRAATERLS